MPTRILIVDDDPDIRDVLKLTLAEENYEIFEAGDGEAALKIINTRPLELVLLDYKIPKIDGRTVCKTVKKDLLLRHLPIIMVTGKGDISDRVGGIDAGADDYVVKPFEPKELLARIRMVLRRTQRDLEANPLTRLPGNVSIINELTRRLESKALFNVCYLDLDKFKAYNDKYGFERGDNVIKETARILIRQTQQYGNSDNFIGHIGGDDFVIVASVGTSDSLCQKIIDDFDKASPLFYNEEDRKKGCIIAKNRQGKEEETPFLSISIGVVSNEVQRIEHIAQIGEIGAELKKIAKAVGKSNYVKDKRKSL